MPSTPLMGLLQLRFEHDSSTIRARCEHDTSTTRYNTLRGFSCARIRDQFEHSSLIFVLFVLHSVIFHSLGIEYRGQNNNNNNNWNEPYSSSSFTKQSCSKMALYRWIRTESRWNKKLISLSSPDWSASLRPSFERKTWPDALIGPNDSTATG